MSQATPRALAVAVVAGLILGVVTQLGQRLLPDALLPIANSISPWLVVAFALGTGASRPMTAAVAAWIALVMALVGYYAMVWIQFGYGASTSSLVLWGVAAIAGGLVFGPAGWLWRHGSDLAAAAAIGLLAAVFIGESIYVYVFLLPDYRTAAILFAVTGLIVPLLLGRSTRQRLTAYVAIVPALALAAVGFAALMGFAGVVTQL